MKQFFTTTLLCISAFFAMTLTSCSSSDNDGPVNHTVTFHSNGGSAVEAQTVEDGGYATEPLSPSKSGSAFDGWYTDNTDFLQAFDFGTPITAATDLYAKWSAITLAALQALVVEAQAINLDNYTSASQEGFESALQAAILVLEADAPAQAQITTAYNALATALSALVPVPHRPVASVAFYPAPIEDVIKLTPGTPFNLYAYALDADGEHATNSAVIFEISLPAWMKDTTVSANSFQGSISETAPANATVVLKAKSAETPSKFTTVTIQVVTAEALKAQFIAVVDALPAPAGITYEHGTSLEAALNLYNMLSYDERAESNVAAAYSKLQACFMALEDLPLRFKYTFSGNIATVTPMKYDGTLDEDESITMTYEKNGNFPCGTYTINSWEEWDNNEYAQQRLVLNNGGTVEMFIRFSTNAQGTNPSQWQAGGIGTYTNQGTQSAAGGILTLDFDDNSGNG
ncbi:MAG: InlB B-repeat-containing protein [Culturomica sp.]|jgi:uncharacterized repeat protein (TIGR02543 family)|nr:InlB B-repeat-containing protein [Culturomica sp.]